MTQGGEALSIDVWPLLGGYGGSEALAFSPSGWSPQAGVTYQVNVTGISPPVSYTVEVVDCDAP